MDEEQAIFEQLFLSDFNKWSSKGTLSSLIQFLATESPLKMMNYFTFKAPHVFKIFKLS